MKLYECKNLPVLQKEIHIAQQMKQKIFLTYLKFPDKHYPNIEYLYNTEAHCENRSDNIWS